MKMQKRKFRIGELAKKLNVERFVIRFWEKEFDVKSNRSHGGQRFYDEKDLEKFTAIKILLYEKGFTIAGARKQLKQKAASQTINETKIIASQKTTLADEKKSARSQSDQEIKNDLEEQIRYLQRQLIKLRELL